MRVDDVCYDQSQQRHERDDTGRFLRVDRQARELAHHQPRGAYSNARTRVTVYTHTGSAIECISDSLLFSHFLRSQYNTEQYEDCGSSTLSTHFFSPDGKSWRSLPGTGMGAVQPYSHTVNYVDGTSHTYTTLEVFIYLLYFIGQYE